MDSLYCLELVMKKIGTNIQCFDQNSDLNHLCSLILKLSKITLEKSFSSELLKNILLAFKELRVRGVLNDAIYSNFLRDINEYYRTKPLCPSYKKEILLFFSPAIEVELLTLLKVCLQVTSVGQLTLIKSKVDESILLQVWENNASLQQKIGKILHVAFISSAGNPAVAYLLYCFYNSASKISKCALFPKDLQHLDIFFQFPHQYLSEKDLTIFIKRLVGFCSESLVFNICTKEEMLFRTCIFPRCFYRLLVLCQEKSVIEVNDFFSSICLTKSFEFTNWLSEVHSAQMCSFWNVIED